jgi:hypothetical protein
MANPRSIKRRSSTPVNADVIPLDLGHMPKLPLATKLGEAFMIVVHALDGTQVDVNEAAVTLVAGPYPHDLGPHTYVHGVDRGVLVTAEDPAALVARLGVDPPLVKLTRPDSTPVWVKGPAVTAIRPPLATESQGGGVVKAVVIIGDLHQAVREDVKAAASILNAPAANV